MRIILAIFALAAIMNLLWSNPVTAALATITITATLIWGVIKLMKAIYNNG